MASSSPFLLELLCEFKVSLGSLASPYLKMKDAKGYLSITRETLGLILGTPKESFNIYGGETPQRRT